MTRFFLYHLRTTDADAARAFYASVLGDGERTIFPLHEQAMARGARPHWLGYLEVPEVDRAAAAFAERGAMQLGKRVNPQGLEAAVMRDPGGAIVAFGKLTGARPAGGGLGAEVSWHLLNTPDVEGAKRNYRELCGWDFGEPFDIAGQGVFHPFAWERGGEQVGAFCDLAGRAGVHPHWLFNLRVPSLERAVEAVRAGGGKVLGPLDGPDGVRMAVCDDPQGAAFALTTR